MEKTELETVDRTITIKLSKDYDVFLEGLAKALNVTVEHILIDELYATLENFVDGGFLEGWTDQIIGNKGSELQKQITQIADTVPY